MKIKSLLTRSLILLAFFSLVLVSCEKEEELKVSEDAKTEESFDIESVVFGCELTSEEELKEIPFAPEKFKSDLKALPSSFSFYCPPIRNQGGEGSCTAWGTTYAARSIMRQRQYGGSYSNSTNIFSPEYVYNQIKLGNCSSGSYVSRALNILYNQGACTWNYMPYNDWDCYTYPNNNQRSNAANYKISNWWRLSVNANTIKQYLAAGYPVVVAGPVNRTFSNHRYGQVIRSYDNYYYGGHAYCVVGYDDNVGAFKVMNSWGTYWGTNGYGWISYNMISRYWNEAYIMGY